MGLRIAILLSGFPSDLPVSVCAVELASRTESKLYALQDSDQIGLGHCETPLVCDSAKATVESIQDNLTFVNELADAANVTVCYHVLEEATEECLADFMINQAISCLVVYVEPTEVSNASIPWIDRLQKRFQESPRWFQGPLQVIVAPPWNKEELEAAIARLLYPKQAP